MAFLPCHPPQGGEGSGRGPHSGHTRAVVCGAWLPERGERIWTVPEPASLQVLLLLLDQKFPVRVPVSEAFCPRRPHASGPGGRWPRQCVCRARRLAGGGRGATGAACSRAVAGEPAGLRGRARCCACAAGASAPEGGWPGGRAISTQGPPARGPPASEWPGGFQRPGLACQGGAAVEGGPAPCHPLPPGLAAAARAAGAPSVLCGAREHPGVRVGSPGPWEDVHISLLPCPSCAPQSGERVSWGRASLRASGAAWPSPWARPLPETG